MAFLTEDEITNLVDQHFGGKNAIDRESARELVMKADKQITLEISEKVEKIRKHISESREIIKAATGVK